MKLVEADAEGPAESSEAIARPTPPRPERRRVMVSLGFTIAILVGTVVTIYAVFPARHDHLATAAVEEHRKDGDFELTRPAPAELRAWSLALLGGSAPLPAPTADVVTVGARRLTLLKQPVAVVRYRIGSDDVTFLVERLRDAGQRRLSRREDDLRVEAWRLALWTCAAVGPEASAATWMPRVGVPAR